MINSFFKKYENKYKGQAAVLFGTGPSLDLYDSTQVNPDISVGTNFIGKHRFFDQNLESYALLDYYFFGDRNRHMDASFKVKKDKFCACEVDGRPHPLHLSQEEGEQLGAYGMSVMNSYPEFTKDISENPTHGESIIFHALNFLFYVGVSKIYIVGCDCSGNTCFNNILGINGAQFGYEPFLNGWRRAKAFVEEGHVETKIISVNPVGLKGFFEEIYTC